MSPRQILPLAAVLFALLPASALAAPTVTVTGDDGNPTPLNSAAPVPIRQLDVQVGVSVPASETAFYNAQVFDAAGAPASLSSCRDPGIPSTRFLDYHGNGTYSVLVRYFRSTDSKCARTPSQEKRFQFTINAGTAVTAPPGLLTRAANSFVTNVRQLPVTTNPGASTYEVRYARGGVIGPDGAISGPSAETFVDRTTGLADFRFDKPGRWVIVARVKGGSFFTPWSVPVFVNAVAPFDLERTSFPDARGPSYKVRGQIRELAARGKVTVSIAKGRKKGKFHRLGRRRSTPRAASPSASRCARPVATGSATATRGPPSWRPGASPSRSASAAASSSASRQLCGPAGVASGAGPSTTRPPLHDPVAADQEGGAGLAPDARAAAARPGTLGEPEPRDQERARVLDPQDLRPARQRAVEEAHVVAAREPDRRGAVGHDARDREVAHRALEVAVAQRVRPAADDGDVARGGRLAIGHRGRRRRGCPLGRRLHQVMAGSAGGREERQTGEEESPPRHAEDHRSRAAPPRQVGEHGPVAGPCPEPSSEHGYPPQRGGVAILAPMRAIRC